MSIEFKMSRGGRNKKFRQHKKTARATLNSIDAPHLPMRVHSNKGGDWGTTMPYPSYISYKKVNKFLMKRIGKPVDKVFSEFLKEAKKYSYNENLENLFYRFLDYEEDKMKYGKANGFYVSNGILNFKNDYSKKDKEPKNLIKYNNENWDESAFDKFKSLSDTGPTLVGKFWTKIKGQYMLLPVYVIFSDKWDNGKGYSNFLYPRRKMPRLEYLKEFTKCGVLGKGYCYYFYEYLDKTLGGNISRGYYFYYIVRVSDIENYKKEKFKKV